MKLAENIQVFRKEKSMSQEELAEQVGVSRQAVTKWESGESVPAIEKLIQLADIFEISIDELVGRGQADPFSKLISLIRPIVVSDIPSSDDDNISAIIHRYLVFTQGMNMDAEDIMRGLKDIFLKE